MIIFLLFVGAMIALWYVRERADAKRRLPGPMQFPLIGSLIQVAIQHPVGFIALNKLSKKYGRAMSVKLGVADFVFVSSDESIKFFYGGDECAERPFDGVWAERNFYKNLGIIFSSGSVYTEIKKFSTQCMRTCGFLNRNWVKDVLGDELRYYMEHLEEEVNSNPDHVVEFTVSGSLKTSFTNIMCALITGERHPYNDKALLDLGMALEKFFRAGTLGLSLMTSFPLIRFVFGKSVGYYDQLECMRGVYQYGDNIIKKRKQLGAYKSGEPSCLIDAFLKKMEDTAKDPNSIYTEEMFRVLIMDIFTGGVETAGNWLLFAVILLLAHPEKQEKMYQEIRTVIGDRLPENEDKSEMTYTQAVMLEVHRWGKVVINLGPRVAVKDFEYDGRLVKKGTKVLGNLYTVYNDKEYWGDPDVFRPERFLDANGKITKAERMTYAFGLGKRMCFGDALARDSGFLYMTTLIQKYELRLPDEYNGKAPSLKLIEGITTCPVEFKVKMVKRQ